MTRGHLSSCEFRCIKDHRTRQEKIEDMAKQTASPLEAAIARTQLKQGTDRVLSRDEILGQAAERYNVDVADLAAAMEYFGIATRRATRATRTFGQRWRDGQKVSKVIYDEMPDGD
jgi:hypothetical protein